jgi:hypothetical protein
VVEVVFTEVVFGEVSYIRRLNVGYVGGEEWPDVHDVWGVVVLRYRVGEIEG